MRLTLPPNRLVVKGEGPKNPKLAFIGEQPGKTELRVGRPFVGPAGREFDACLAMAGVVRSDHYITNVIKDYDHSIDHYIKLKGTPRTLNDGDLYIDYLKQELFDIKPQMAVALGGISAWALTGRQGITKWRGSIVESTLIPGLPVALTLHPATILPPKNVYLNKYLISYDIKKALRVLENGSRDSDIPVNITPTLREAVEFLSWILEHDEHYPIESVDFDIEVIRENVTCLAFTFKERSMCIPFVNGAGDRYSLEEETALWKLIANILENEKIAKRGQNLVFDSSFLLRRYGIKISGPINDTMIAQKISYPDFRAGLDFITSVHTDMPYYKAEGKKYMKFGGSYENFWTYNALDTIATARAFPRIYEELAKQGNIETYQRQVGLIPPLTYMTERGIKIDLPGMTTEAGETSAQVKKLEAELKELTGTDLNPRSPTQLKEYFYKTLKHKPYLKDGKPTTDETAMKRLARKGVKEADLILEHRRLSKRLGVYLNHSNVDPDGRYRSSYNPVGAETGRLSSSKNIFDTGGNQQNWPHDLLRYMVADEGYLYFSFDLSQIENRIVAYVGRVVEMIEAFEQGIDMHRLTASRIFDKPIEEISDEPGSSTIGGSKYSERFWGKKANHSLNYGEGFRKFALTCEIPENDGKRIVEGYHKAYPGIRGNYHQIIKAMLLKDRTVTNLYGRKRVFLDQLSLNTYNQAYAHLPQSTVADKINKEGICFIYYNTADFGPVELLNQIHDSVGFQIPLLAGWDRIARILMLIKSSLERSLYHNGREIPVLADLTIGLNLSKSEGKELKHKNFPPSTEALSWKLKELYEELTNERQLSQSGGLD